MVLSQEPLPYTDLFAIIACAIFHFRPFILHGSRNLGASIYFIHLYWDFDLIFVVMYGYDSAMATALAIFVIPILFDMSMFLLVDRLFYIHGQSMGSEIWFGCTLKGFSSQRITPMIQFFSSVCVCLRVESSCIFDIIIFPRAILFTYTNTKKITYEKTASK